MRYPASEKLEITRLVEQSHLPTKQTLVPTPASAERKPSSNTVKGLSAKPSSLAA